MKTPMKKLNWLTLACVILLTGAMGNVADAAPPQKIETRCDDGRDNDRDGVIDCADSDCSNDPVCQACTPSGVPESICNGVDDDCDTLIDEDYVETATSCGVGECVESGLLVCQSGSEIDTCSSGLPPEDPELSCDDTLDNDCDGLTDSGDSDCPVTSAEVCDDGVDNDLDNLIDCADPDCSGFTVCTASNKLVANLVSENVLGIGPDNGLWNATSATTYNMAWRDDINDTCPPANNCSGQQPTLMVKAIYDGNAIAFLMTWNDTTQSSEVHQSVEFGDRAVIMLNANRICQMGSPNNPTNMWFWNAADKTQGAGGSVQNLLGGGIGTVTHTDGDDNIIVISNHTGSEWQVVMSRQMAPLDPADEFEFTVGTTEVAFALYDGAFKQRNGSKWISGREAMEIAP